MQVDFIYLHIESSKDDSITSKSRIAQRILALAKIPFASSF
jgi:hypothetical protein